ncbi:hypothetical protein TRFO_25592 [Tritrichomonas foetus]|uniref:ARF GAP-like zinc finger-containing protein n=1 Tax=Tritrichomonas foetus TaxID=1144522 RepID=A0A1J4K4L3_9EUKA|nr:hypothetical protein TRFO_25592 [Tritrichomonas foetus]|eukprot:OHT06327.1 hypothetical protein TRFO_25592 [Tritrichomonas foetus]
MNFDPSNIANLHENPMYLMEQSQRYQHITDMSAKVQKIEKIISRYVTLGDQLCDTIKESIDTLNEIEFVCTNRNFTSILQLINEFQLSLRTHFTDIQETSVTPMKKFIKQNLPELAESKRIHSKNLEKYYVVQDHYLSLPKKSKQKLYEDRQIEFRKAFTDSAQSFFEYLIKIDSSEAQMNNLIGSFLTNFPSSFINSTHDVLKRALKKTKNAKKKDVENLLPDFHKIAKRAKSCRKEFLSSLPIFFQQQSARAGPDRSMVLKQGYLWKKNGKFGKSFDRFYFVCNQGVLSYSPNVEMAHNPPKTLELVLASVSPNETEERPFCFTISTQNKVLILQAPSQRDYDEWMNTIQNGIFAKLAASSPLASRTHGEIPILPTIQKTTDLCADCDKLDTDWYILNRALTICEHCAGIHRSIPQSSTVRSLKLDTIDRFNLKIREVLSKNVINEFIEYEYPDDKIDDQSTPEERQSFIRHKYIDKLYIDPNYEVPDVFVLIQNQDLLELMKVAFIGSLDASTNVLRGNFKPIHAAACVGNPLLIVAIAQNSQQIDDLDENGWSALSYATFYNNIKAVEALIAFGADIGASTEAHPYIVAHEKHHEEMIQKFKNYPVQYDEEHFPELVPLNTDFTPQPIKKGMEVKDEENDSKDIMTRNDRIQIQQALKSMSRKGRARRRSVASFDQRVVLSFND